MSMDASYELLELYSYLKPSYFKFEFYSNLNLLKTPQTMAKPSFPFEPANA